MICKKIEEASASVEKTARKIWRPIKVAECDGGGDAGGAAAGGDAGGASAGDAGSVAISDVASGTGSSEVLGNCNHGGDGDGFLGKDCFHVPVPCAVPFHRWEIGNGGSKRKKTKKGKDKHYAYEKGMKVVYDMLHEDDAKKVNIPKKLIKARLVKIAKAINSMRDAEAASRKFDAKGAEKANKFPSRFKQVKEAFLDIGAFLKDICTGNYKASWFTISLLAIAIVYVLSPVDLIPDVILGVGQIDDAVVIMWVFSALKDEFDAWKAWKTQGKEDSLEIPASVDVGQMIAEWNDTHIPRGRVNRHETGIPVKYWVAIDDYSEILNNYSCFVDWSMNLTPLANNQRPTFLTVDAKKIRELANRAKSKWPSKYVFIGVDDSSRGMQTQKNHLRASVKCIWNPKIKMWTGDQDFNESEDQQSDVDARAMSFRQFNGTSTVQWRKVTELVDDNGNLDQHIWLRAPNGILVCRVDSYGERPTYYIPDLEKNELVEVGRDGFAGFVYNYSKNNMREVIPDDMPKA